MRLTHSSEPYRDTRGNLQYNGRFVMRDCSYEQRGIPKAAGFWWHGVEKVWWTPLVAKARLLAEYADEAALAKIGGHEANLKASAASDADIEIPMAAGMQLLPFQRAGVKYILDRFAEGRRGVYLCDEQGLGKSPQAIAVINATPEIQTALVVVPASLKLNWLREFGRFQSRGLRVAIWTAKAQPEADVAIVNYDQLTRLKSVLGAREWDIIIYDECHFMKNPKAQRTKVGLSLPAKRGLFLSGTPLLNRPIELFPVLQRIDPDEFRSYPSFGIRYCAGHQTRWGWDFTGASRLDELQEKLRSRYMVRRLKADVLTELPAKRRQIVPLEADAAAKKLIKAQTKAWDKIVEAIGYDEAVAQLTAGGGIAFEEISEARKALAVAKIPAAVEFIKEALESSEKVVVFAHHHEVLDALTAELAEFGAVLLDGRQSAEARQAAVDRFQADPSCRIFVGGILAAGVGLTLTAASHVICVELSYRPADMAQAEDRCHRIGQTDSVLVQHLVHDDSLDAHIAQMLVDKAAVADSALDHDHDADKAAVIAEAKAEAAIETAKQKVIRGEAEAKIAAGPALTLEQIGWIHHCLRLLAGRCDFAAKKDDSGFNAMDAKFGHALADKDKLSTRMAQAGYTLLRKYRRQIDPAIYAAIYNKDAAAFPVKDEAAA